MKDTRTKDYPLHNSTEVPYGSTPEDIMKNFEMVIHNQNIIYQKLLELEVVLQKKESVKNDRKR